jgi:hypothetical protein
MSSKPKAKKPKLTDDERHQRFKETAKKLGASEDPRDFERAFKTVTTPKSERKASR